MVIRLVIAMTLLPGSSYAEAMRTVAGLLADVPFTLDWHVPAGKSIGEWRLLIPPEIMQEVFWHAAGALIGDDEPSAVMVAGMPADAADGMLVNLADTKENRDYFGTTGTGDGSSPFPQLRIIALTARAGRAIRGAVLGKACDGEQTLLKTLAAEQPGLFAGRVTLFDRNFPGHDLILAILLAGGHVIARAKGGISLPFQDAPDKGWLTDGSRVSWLNAPSGKKEDRLPVRVAEHSALVAGPDGEQVSETCTLITTLLDEVRPCRLASSGTPTRTGGPRRRPPSARTRPPSPAPGTAPPAPSSAPAARGSSSRRPGPGSPRPSWSARARPPPCAARRPPPAPCAARTPGRSPPTRNRSPPPGTTPSAPWKPARSRPPPPSPRSPPRHDSAARAHLHTLNIPGRDRHSPRKQKARPKFPHTSATKQTVTGKYQVIVYAPGRC